MIPEPVFVFFGSAHTVTLVTVTLAVIATWPLARLAARRGRAQTAAWALAVLMVAVLVVKMGLFRHYGTPWVQLLPLHICNASVFLCALMLVMRSYRLYEVAYFWAIGGSVAAMLTPDLHRGFPHPIFIAFFVSHALTVISALYATFAYGFQPRLRSVGIAIAASLLYAAVVLPLNFALGTNFLFLRAKPATPTVLDYLGPWPWYLIGLIALLVVVCLICYAPFAIVRKYRAG